ncbi:ABC transporter ATP-binding protein [Allobacillus halotolerans]|uniref:ABC transporter ATP-binding protein n=1 Tax=Allobacillus halotolerans TaxID=570278 RepID=A0ABS6GRP0_9BACI|nr:ABC transporter ATP-binding protein [Allobacillus halotolerans]MBU6081581.1 ABC transporter ATP-binding protein [Allobacillus halotolerans]
MELVSVNDLTKTYSKHAVVDHVSFDLQPGKCVALLGPNGAGKTTTLRMLAGFIQPTSGSISFNEDTLSKDFRKFVGYLPQYPSFYPWMSGEEFLHYAGQLAGLTKKEASDRSNELLQLVHLTESGKKRIGKYSGGMKQRLGIAQALIHEPKLIMLDEPVSSLDPIGRREVLNLIRELKKDATVLFSTHILNDAEEVSEEILLMNDGKLIEQGPISEIRGMQQTVTIRLAFEKEPKFIHEKLKEIDSVYQVTEENGTFDVSVHDLNAARDTIFSRVQEEGWELSLFEITSGTLEDIFMKAVNK